MNDVDHDLVALRLKAWTVANRLRPAGGHVCAARVVGRRCPRHYAGRLDVSEAEAGCRPPGSDHSSLWYSVGHAPRRYVFITQPYEWTTQTAIEAIAWGHVFGMGFLITAWQSWHYPGHTLAVVWHSVKDFAPHGGGEEDAEASTERTE